MQSHNIFIIQPCAFCEKCAKCTRVILHLWKTLQLRYKAGDNILKIAPGNTRTLKFSNHGRQQISFLDVGSEQRLTGWDAIRKSQVVTV